MARKAEGDDNQRGDGSRVYSVNVREDYVAFGRCGEGCRVIFLRNSKHLGINGGQNGSRKIKRGDLEEVGTG